MPRIIRTSTNGMSDQAQVDAYVAQDRQGLIDTYIAQILVATSKSGYIRIADLGCGCGDYYKAFTQAFPQATFVGYDASIPMITASADRINVDGVTGVSLVNSIFPDALLPVNDADLVVSAFCLNQLTNPIDFWNTVKQIAKTDAEVFIWDMIRIDDAAICTTIINSATPECSAQFALDFQSALRASFLLEEVQQQLIEALLPNLQIQTINMDAYWQIIIISGKI